MTADPARSLVVRAPACGGGQRRYCDLPVLRSVVRAPHLRLLPDSRFLTHATEVCMADWVNTIIAGAALAVSVVTAGISFLRNRRHSRTANVTAYFHWNQEKSRVDLPDRTIKVGYNLVIWNQGPATARDLDIEVRRPNGGAPVRLASVEEGEFPLSRLDSGVRYPLQFAPDMPEFYEYSKYPTPRRFDLIIRWTDDNGRHERLIPLRRGKTGD